MVPDPTLALPTSVVSRSDVTRLLHELEAITDVLDQSSLREKKAAPIELSNMLYELTDVNYLDLNQTQHRAMLKAFLSDVKAKAPTVHMSFAAEAPIPFIQKIITWLRTEVTPLVLLEVGLQPSIAAGCIIRTTNKYFDCSIGQNLRANRDRLVAGIHGVKNE